MAVWLCGCACVWMSGCGGAVGRRGRNEKAGPQRSLLCGRGEWVTDFELHRLVAAAAAATTAAAGGRGGRGGTTAAAAGAGRKIHDGSTRRRRARRGAEGERCCEAAGWDGLVAGGEGVAGFDTRTALALHTRER